MQALLGVSIEESGSDIECGEIARLLDRGVV